jgi:hypothetical protein
MSSQDVDTEDSQDELNGGKDIRRSWLLCQASDDCSDQLPLSPQRPSPFPEAGTLTYDPRLGQCHLEEQDLLYTPEILDDTTITNEQCSANDSAPSNQHQA